MIAVIKKFNLMSPRKKTAFIIAVVLTLVFGISICVFAWFSSQRKAAELYKVEFPNSLYLNAAHREDRMYFNLSAISPYKMDPINDTFLYDNNGELIPVNNQKYVFSVSGSNTTSYRLQLAHTNNNQFTYTIYPATQYSSENSVPSGTDPDDIVPYALNTGSHTENSIQVTSDPYNDTVDEGKTKYYVKSSSSLPGEYKNNKSGTTNNLIKAQESSYYYEENYSSMTNVQEDDIPSYWQSDSISVVSDANKKFCHYYILVVAWPNKNNVTIEKKETDMVYITAER